MGFFEAIRRSVEFILAMIVVGCVWAFPQHWRVIIIGFAVGYSLLLVPLIACLLRLVPRNAIAHQDNTSASTAALLGLLKVMAHPRIWLAGLAAMCLYWAYVNLIYSSAPYLKLVYNVSDGVAGLFGATTTSLVGALICIPSGFVADYIFKSSAAMMTAALTVVGVSAAAVYMLPSSKMMMWPAIILLIVMSVGVFMGKSVILAPIAELDLPEEVNGSAMAVASFLAYASIIWGNSMTSGIVESHRHNAYEGYQTVFLITLAVALAGAACAFALTVVGRGRGHV